MMIRGVGNQSNIYQNNNNANAKKAAQTANEEKMSRLEELKTSIENGEYKVDLDKLAQKMAQDLS
jgi:anti-sigma28 factor (negative regulator of flagellin synthesis)